MKSKKIRNIIKIFASVGFITPIIAGAAVSCGNVVVKDASFKPSTPTNPYSPITPAKNPYSPLTPAVTDNNFWLNKEKQNLKEKTIIWDASTTKTIPDMLDQINSQMKIKMSAPSIDEMTPYQLGMYLVNFYNNNGGGKLKLEIKYKNNPPEVVFLDISSNLNAIIKSFDSGKQPIRENSPFSPNITFSKTVMSILKKIGDSGGVTDLLKLFGQYGSDVFGIDTLSLVKLFLTDTTGASKPSKISRLMDSLPTEAIVNFNEQAVPIFSKLGKYFSNSKLGQEWAKDNGVSKEFLQLDHDVIRWVLGNSLIKL